jgi:hypothetical protein
MLYNINTEWVSATRGEKYFISTATPADKTTKSGGTHIYAQRPVQDRRFSKAIRDREHLRVRQERGEQADSKRVRYSVSSKEEDFDSLILNLVREWDSHIQDIGTGLAKSILFTTAEGIAADIGKLADDGSPWRANNGWLKRLGGRYGGASELLRGSAGSVSATADNDMETTVRRVLATYPLRNIFNADEGGLYFPTPNR